MVEYNPQFADEREIPPNPMDIYDLLWNLGQQNQELDKLLVNSLKNIKGNPELLQFGDNFYIMPYSISKETLNNSPRIRLE